MHSSSRTRLNEYCVALSALSWPQTPLHSPPGTPTPQTLLTITVYNTNFKDYGIQLIIINEYWRVTRNVDILCL